MTQIQPKNSLKHILRIMEYVEEYDEELTEQEIKKKYGASDYKKFSQYCLGGLKPYAHYTAKGKCKLTRRGVRELHALRPKLNSQEEDNKHENSGSSAPVPTRWQDNKWIVKIGTAVIAAIIAAVVLSALGLQPSSTQKISTKGSANTAVMGESNTVVGGFNNTLILGNQVIYNLNFNNGPENLSSCSNQNLSPIYLPEESLPGNCSYLKSEFGQCELGHIPAGSVMAWIRLLYPNATEDRYVIQLSSSQDESLLDIFITKNQIVKFRMMDANKQEFVISYDNKIPLYQWTLIVASWAKEGMDLYVNRNHTNSIKLKDANFEVPIRQINIGATFSRRLCLNGVADSAAVFNKPLNLTEIDYLYNSRNSEDQVMILTDQPAPVGPLSFGEEYMGD